MTGQDLPIAYTALSKGTPMLTAAGRQFGTVEHVLQVPEEDLFEGVVAATDDGIRFVVRDQIESIFEHAVHCALTDEQVSALPAPDGSPIYTVDSLQDAGDDLGDRLGRLFRRPRWTIER